MCSRLLLCMCSIYTRCPVLPCSNFLSVLGADRHASEHQRVTRSPYDSLGVCMLHLLYTLVVHIALVTHHERPPTPVCLSSHSDALLFTSGQVWRICGHETAISSRQLPEDLPAGHWWTRAHILCGSVLKLQDSILRTCPENTLSIHC